MTSIVVDYASPSAFEADRERALLGLTANARRPVRFAGRVREHLPMLRFALRALGEAIWAHDGWLADDETTAFLDPVITVHPDRLFFEAFSRDESTYVRLAVDPAIFEIEGEVRPGTTNVDFTAWLWGALGEMRSSRATELRIEAQGFQVATRGAGGRYEAKVKLPDAWVRGFLQVTAAMTLPGTRIALRPIDLLAAIRYLRYTNARVSPRALRYEFPPGEEARLVLEPWEHTITLRGAEHGYGEMRTIRTWGRQRLRLIEPLLPFASAVRVYLKGRALPSFYAVDLPGMSFLLGLSGWAGERWTRSVGFDLATREAADDALLGRALGVLEQRLKARADEIAGALGVDRMAASRLLDRLARRGQVMVDPETREFRHRELFETPIDEASFYPPDVRIERAARFLADGAVRVEKAEAEETRKVRRFKTESGRIEREVIYRDWRVAGAVGAESAVSIVINDGGQVIFGQCGCAFFREHLFSRGPCEHMLALFHFSRDRLTDAPSSRAAQSPPERLYRDPNTGALTAGGSWHGGEQRDAEDGDAAIDRKEADADKRD